MNFVIKGVPKSLFSSTFAVCFALVGANSILPCPVDNNYANDSIIDERLKQVDDKTKDYKDSK